MAFRFRRKESVAQGFRRIVREQTAMIVSLLADPGPGLKERVHDARRSLKRLRALLRLVRDGMDEAAFTEANTAFRDAGRRLGSTRDAEVAVATFDRVAKKLAPVECAGARQILADEIRRARRASLSAAQLAKIATTVRKTGHTLAETSLLSDEWLLLGPGLGDALRSARKMRRCITTAPESESLHEWRKRIKRLHIQLSLLRRALAKDQRKAVACLEAMAEELGEHHDLHLLKALLAEYHAHGVAAADCEAVNTAIDGRMKAKLRKVRKLSRTAFRGSAKTFLNSAHRSWKAWRE